MSILKRCYDVASYIYGQGNSPFWNNRFAWLRKIIKNTLEIAKLPVAQDASILDLGCGTGIASEEFLKLHPQTKEIIGVDLSSKMGERAKKNLNSRFSFRNNDYTEKALWQDWSERFQGILAFYTFHWIPRRKYSEIIQLIHRALVNKGWLIGVAMGSKDVGGIFDDLIDELLHIYLTPLEVAKVLDQWNPKEVSEIEKVLHENDFSYSRITSLRYNTLVKRFNDLLSIILYQYSFWLSGLDPILFPSIRAKLIQFIKNDSRFYDDCDRIQVPHHLVIFEAHKS